ncbi:hypothetical protein IAR50_002090 [Cryptococcus sp. DSM 104548]
MPPRIPLPRLTLFTGGKECSLCEVAKEQLTLLRQSHPFDITYWNIRSPPLGTEAHEAKKWRRLYQYDIPRQAWEGTGRMEGRAGKAGERESGSGVNKAGAGTLKRFRPYRSLLAWQQPAEFKEDVACTTTEYSKPPWRTAIGTVFFSFSSPVVQAGPEDGLYSEILQRAFRNFSDVPVGSDVPVLKLGITTSSEAAKEGEMEEGEVDEKGQEEIGVELDTVGEDWVEGDTSWIFFDQDDGDGPVKDHRTHLTCWNCGETGHGVYACPLPYNRVMVLHSRNIMNYERDNVPPRSVAPFLRNYLDSRVTEAERQRRLRLNDAFVPGWITTELDHALRWMDDEEADQTGTRYRNGEKEWIVAMARWGYPPGWIASQDPIKILHERISSLKTYDSPFPAFDDDVGDLFVVGGVLEDPREAREDSAMSIDPPSSPFSHPPPPSSPPPPQPLSPPPPPPPSQFPPRKRYAMYNTDMFESDRLAAFDEVAQVPLGTFRQR